MMPTPPATSATARTDLGNAEHFAAHASANLRYVHERKKWIVWTGQHWRDDVTDEAERAAKTAVRVLLERAAKIDDSDQCKKAVHWALTSRSAAKIRAMLDLARSDAAIALSQEQLDTDPFALACPNGTIDLRTGRLRAANPDDLITRATTIRYTPGAFCPRFETFLLEVFDRDLELIDWLQRFVGYCLTGDTREHVLAVFYGRGCNGKSTLVTVLEKLLGGLATTASFDTFAPRTSSDHAPRNDLARLHGARLVTASESGQNRRLDEATVKEITGGGRIAARFLYGEHFEFAPTFKIVLTTNHKPTIRGTDDGIWRRIRLVPFEQSFLDRKDPALEAALDAELPGILAWAVQGCLAWQEHGLGAAAAVMNATQEYRNDEDVLGAFLRDCCVLGVGTVAVTELRRVYEEWCQGVGEQPLGARQFGKALLARDGIAAGPRSKHQRTYSGLRIAGLRAAG